MKQWSDEVMKRWSDEVMKCPVSLQGVAAEAVAWGVSRAAHCSWPSKSSTDSLLSSSSSWPCWRRSVSIDLPASRPSALLRKGFTAAAEAAEIPAVTCATSPARLWSQWLNSCSQHSADLLANSTGSCWHQEWEAGRGGGGGLGGRARKTRLSYRVQPLHIKRYFAPARFTWQLLCTSRCFLHQRRLLLGLKVVNLHLLQPFRGFQSREPVSEWKLTP